MNQLILKKEQLPVTTEDLFKFILVGKERLRAQQAKIRAIDKINMAHAAKEAALEDAQDIADILLDAEAKLGEMLDATNHRGGKSDRSSRGGTSNPLPPGITKKDSHYAQELARNKDIVEEMKQKAREEGEIATRTTVLKAIKKKKSDELRNNDTEPNKGIVFNETNENIDWAKWSWNPVTGCKHGCKYCYARDIANRFYKEKFEPTFRPYRLKAPFNTQIPSERIKELGIHNVFVCSMADLFGKWVPQEWIDSVLNVVSETPQWNYIFLTKNPERMVDIVWPDNAWVGTTVDIQARVNRVEKAFKDIEAKVKFVSCEPLSENLDFTDLTIFDWVIIGARSKSTKMPAIQPKAEWVLNLMNQAYESGCKIYCKPNLNALIKEYPF